MAVIIKPDTKGVVVNSTTPSVFLAGSIEMGVAENWQERIEKIFEDEEVTFFNPRRDDWDSSSEQKQSNEQFNYQVNWELNHLEKSDAIFMYFSPETKSPISLLELGLYARSEKMIVCCPDEFWRKGNVEVVCTKYNVPLFNNLEDALGALRTKIYSL